MFVTSEDFEDWQEEETIREFENEFTHHLDFHAWEEELLTPDPEKTAAGAGMPPPHRP